MRRNQLVGEVCSEFAGTMILILFGVGVVAQVVTGGGTAEGASGIYDSIAWAWGIGVTMGVYVAARLSGAHINPAVTIALAAFKGFSWGKVAPYIGAQMLGAFAAALIVRFTYAEQIKAIDPDLTSATQGIYSTSNAETVGLTTAFFDQVVGTAILVMVIFALTTALNNPPMGNIGPVVVGLLVVGIGMAWGSNAGYAINPARDLGPRLASWMTGYEDAFLSATTGEVYFWIPIVGPIVGGLLGGALFKFLIEGFLPYDEDATAVSEPIPNE